MKTYRKIGLLLVAAFILFVTLTGCGSGGVEVYYSPPVHVTYQPYQEIVYAGEFLYSNKIVFGYLDYETDLFARFPNGTIVRYTVPGDMKIYRSYETLSIVYDHLSDGTVAGPYLIADYGTSYYWEYPLLDTVYQ